MGGRVKKEGDWICSNPDDPQSLITDPNPINMVITSLHASMAFRSYLLYKIGILTLFYCSPFINESGYVFVSSTIIEGQDIDGLKPNFIHFVSQYFKKLKFYSIFSNL